MFIFLYHIIGFTCQRPSNSNNNESLLLFWWPMESEQSEICRAKIKKLFVSVSPPGWNFFFFGDAGGNIFLNLLLNKDYALYRGKQFVTKLLTQRINIVFYYSDSYIFGGKTRWKQRIGSHYFINGRR